MRNVAARLRWSSGHRVARSYMSQNLSMNINRKLYLLCFLSLVFSAHGAAAVFEGKYDLREKLLQAARKSDKDFPDDKDVLLTHFSYLGKLHTKQGVVYVVDLRSVINNMPAPRGQNAILFFNARLKFLGRQAYASSLPLWCEKGKLYLWGDLDGFVEQGAGNVIDLTQGYRKRRVYHEDRYGSSGGILDK